VSWQFTLEININFDDIKRFIYFEYKIEIKDNDRYVIKPKNVNNVYFW